MQKYARAIKGMLNTPVQEETVVVYIWYGILLVLSRIRETRNLSTDVQKFLNLRPLLSITFPQVFRKSKKFGHWTLESGGKKTFKRSERMKKSLNNFFCCRDFTPFISIFPHLRPLLSIIFPKGFWKYKIFEHWTLGKWGKKDR